MSDEVLVEESGNVAILTINRPKARNAINGAVARGVAEALDTLDARPDISAYVLTGAGGTFSAGMDLKGFLSGDFPVVKGRGFGGLTEAPPKKPLVAAVEGYALAGGFELALACDVIVASSESKFGLPEPKRGLVAGAGGIMRLPRRIPYHVAMEMALTGDHYDAARLYELGLVNRITEPGAALEGALELAKKIAANAPLALAATKKVVIESQDWSLEEMFEKQAAIINPVFGSKDAMEGAAAFAEKRAPQWKGE
ncbi:Enoyl-CoA hydratase [[Actinomadura] parvosata subsp. kistnae]|uniref:Enoyl-CoA hydratase n=2 Tax=Nonomuraea TaxID=83681 RepID=A0A1V0A9S8_9ACTN|nr:crotonase/enoyl-CoA hydratase family protein [Nonomuraea sp. ATCC 55076]AQZ66980.1 enoyl-CoA hydratase [Nonomuraea sp. ATCC 55076]NJP92051.1 crotonase/enoyl-CoA hydratase family protein [Nonomuraea sp. FMUSA5-5]SPL94854.1 Enoyl-CoA hydratase [Actinomadura parvosata subsp. kistnae]